MRCYQAGLIAAAFTAAALGAPRPRPAAPANFSGKSALAFTQAVVSLGPRPPGSRPHGGTELYIESQIKLHHAELIEDSFTAQTPNGSMHMKNIIAKFGGSTGRAVVFTGHYDTKFMPGRGFLGANDGGSSTGFLLEMLRVLATRKYPDDIFLVWFDGEEAFREWSATDSLYGSRHLAERWSNDGTASRIKALINVDMIGDKDLGILQEGNSSRSLMKLVWQTARDIGYGKYFLDTGFATEDDHIPFVRQGVNALDLIDFDYGPNNAYWHTPQDTMDKLSAHSLQVVGDVLLAVLGKLEE